MASMELAMAWAFATQNAGNLRLNLARIGEQPPPTKSLPTRVKLLSGQDIKASGVRRQGPGAFLWWLGNEHPGTIACLTSLFPIRPSL